MININLWKTPLPWHAKCSLAVAVRKNHRMRAVRLSASRAEKDPTALLGTRTAPCDAISQDFVSFKHPSYLQPEKQMQTTY